MTATVRKRQEYLEWAKQNQGIIVEDDFDSEFFMPGKPIDTLYMTDHTQSVIQHRFRPYYTAIARTH